MKVKFNDGRIPFRCIQLGSLFCMEKNELCIRCEIVKTNPTNKYNAVQVRDGKLIYVDADKLVKEVTQITCEV